MSNVYLQSGYAWRRSTRLSKSEIDATRVGREIETLESVEGRRLTDDDLIAAGVGGTGELAKCFTQDRDKAAHKRWKDEAAYVLRHLVPVIVDTHTEEETPLDQRVWVPVYTQTNHLEDSGVYERVPLVTDPLPVDPPPDRHMKGWIELLAWRDAYADDPFYAPVIEAIDRLKA